MKIIHSITAVLFLLFVIELHTTAYAQDASQSEGSTKRYTRRTQTPGRTSSSRPSFSSIGSFSSGIVDTMQSVVYLYPLDIQVEVNKDFSTNITIDNPKAKPFDEIYFAITYDPNLIQFKEYSDENISSFLKPSSKRLLYKEGLIIYSAEFTTPITPTNEKLVNIQWKGIEPTSYTEISFTRHNGKFSCVRYRNKDILASKYSTTDGFIPAGVTIEPPKTKSLQEFYDDLSDKKDPLLFGKQVGGAKMSLVSTKKAIKAGDTFDVDVALDNSKGSFTDAVNLYIEYDPSILEIIDYDDENWITRGINIYDGAYHKKYPFDYLIKNEANTIRGEIIYKAGLSYSTKLPSGVLATIKCRALKPSESTTISFKVKTKATDDTGTSLTYVGTDALGSPRTLKDGLKNLTISIKPK